MGRTPLLILLLIGSLLSACGWQLRSAVDLPPALQTLHVEAEQDYSPLLRSLGEALRVAGVELLPADGNVYRLQLRNENSNSREVSVDRRARSAERELSQSVVILLRDPQGRIVFGPMQLNSSRIYSYDPNNVIAKGDEERLLRRELIDNLTGQILRAMKAAAGRLREPVDAGAGSDAAAS
jgi:LPS-assembly lipoprotein